MRPDLIPALTCQGQHLDDRAERKANLPSRLDDHGQLLIREHAMASLLPGRGGDAGAGRHLKDAAPDAPVEELAHGRENPVRHDGRAALANAIEEGDHIALAEPRPRSRSPSRAEPLG